MPRSYRFIWFHSGLRRELRQAGTLRETAAFPLKFGVANGGLDELCPFCTAFRERDSTNVVAVSVEYDSFFTVLCSSPLPRIPLEIISSHAETPSHKLNFEERKQLAEDVSVAEVEQAARALEQSSRSQRTFY